jgi:hypothetical protein
MPSDAHRAGDTRGTSADAMVPQRKRADTAVQQDLAKWGTTLKRALTVALAGVLTFGVVYGFAASLNLTTESLGAANTTVAACQSGALTATYTSSYSATVPGYAVGTVTVTGLASTCYSKGYKITLSGAGSASLGEASGTTPSSGASFAATFSPAINAVSITGIGVVISG